MKGELKRVDRLTVHVKVFGFSAAATTAATATAAATTSATSVATAAGGDGVTVSVDSGGFEGGNILRAGTATA